MDRRPRMATKSVALLAFVAIVGAASIADLWLLGAARWDRPVSALLGAMLAAGLVMVVRPASGAVSGIIAVAASSTLTLLYWREGFRFTFFLDAAVLPVLTGGLLLNRARSAQVAAVVVAVTGLAVGLRSPVWAVRSILTLSMFIALALAVTAVAYVRLSERERRTSVELARQSERVDLAREIHDVVGHHVTGMIVLAQGQQFARRGSGEAGSDELDSALRQIEAAGQETMAAVRRLVGAARAGDGVPVGDPTDLTDVERVVEDLANTHPLTRLDVDPTLRRRWVPPDLASTVYRIVQEAATNVRRHGDAEEAVSFALEHDGSMVVISVENTATSGDLGDGFGLVGMRERIELVGGTFDAGPVDADRWRLRAALPTDTRTPT